MLIELYMIVKTVSRRVDEDTMMALEEEEDAGYSSAEDVSAFSSRLLS